MSRIRIAFFFLIIIQNFARFVVWINTTILSNNIHILLINYIFYYFVFNRTYLLNATCFVDIVTSSGKKIYKQIKYM